MREPTTNYRRAVGSKPRAPSFGWHAGIWSAFLVAALLLAAGSAAASPVLEHEHDGRLVTKEQPALPPPLGPTLAVPGGEQDCPLPPASAKPSATAASSKSVTR